MKQQRKPYAPRNPQQEKTSQETIPTQKLSGGSIAEVTIDNDGMVSVGAGKSIPFQTNDKFTETLAGDEAHMASTKVTNGLSNTVSKKIKGTSSYNEYN